MFFKKRNKMFPKKLNKMQANTFSKFRKQQSIECFLVNIAKFLRTATVATGPEKPEKGWNLKVAPEKPEKP